LEVLLFIRIAKVEFIWVDQRIVLAVSFISTLLPLVSTVDGLIDASLPVLPLWFVCLFVGVALFDPIEQTLLWTLRGGFIFGCLLRIIGVVHFGTVLRFVSV